MQAKEIGMFVLCISLAVGIVNALGVFPQLAGGEAATSVSTLDIYQDTGIQDLNGMSATEDVSLNEVLNGGLIGAAIKAFITMIGLLIYPYGLLTGWGVPPLFAAPIQLITNAATVWSIAQFASNRSGKSMD